MFWRRKDAEPQAGPGEVPSFRRYVVEKVAPRSEQGREGLVRVAGIALRRGESTLQFERMLLGHGLEDAMLASVALALAVEDAGGLPLSDLEYGDCYLCAVFCLASDLRGTPDAATNALEEWRQRLDEHVDYLVFGAKDSLDDLTESGWERFLRYHDHPDAILPQAYLHLLSQAVRHRRGGSATPYADLDPMVQSEPLVVAALEQAWETKAHVFATIGTASSTSCATPPRSMTASSGRSRRATSTKDAR